MKKNNVLLSYGHTEIEGALLDEIFKVVAAIPSDF
jgi:hypothetical protein